MSIIDKHDSRSELIRLHQQLHEQGDAAAGVMINDMFPGTALLPHIKPIKEHLTKLHCKSVLDYGCGKASIYQSKNIRLKDGTTITNVQSYWNVNEIAFYDPAVQCYSKFPSSSYDAVICTDVLEHCHEQDLENIISELFNLANKFVYANIASYPAEKFLPNGDNAHITIRPPEWWRNLIERVAASNKISYLFLVEEKKPRGKIGSIQLPFFKGVSRVFTHIKRS